MNEKQFHLSEAVLLGSSLSCILGFYESHNGWFLGIGNFVLFAILTLWIREATKK